MKLKTQIPFVFIASFLILFGLSQGVYAEVTYPKVSGYAAPFDVATFPTTDYMTFGDIDGDGVTDLLWGCDNERDDGIIRYYKKDSSGSYLEKTSGTNLIDISCEYDNCQPHLYDLSGDGFVDLVLANYESEEIRYFVNNKDETFTEKTGTDNPFDAISVYGIYSLSFFDVDKDGDQDLIFFDDRDWDGSTNMGYYTNSGGTFTDATGTSIDPFRDLPASLYEDYPHADFYDVNADGTKDLIIKNYLSNASYYLLTDGKYVLQDDSTNPFTGFGTISYHLGFTDLSGDGQDDMLFIPTSSTSSYSVDYYINVAGTLTLATRSDNPLSGATAAKSPFFYDYDGDGDTDFVTGSDAYSYLPYCEYNIETKTFSFVSSSENPFMNLFLSYDFKPTFWDVNSDDKLDLIAGNGAGTLYYYQNNGDNTFTKINDSVSPFGGIDTSFRSAPTFADWDGDGDQDLILGSSDGKIVYFTNDGDNTFTSVATADSPFKDIDLPSTSSPAAYDVDHDGFANLLLGETSGALWYYEIDSSTGLLTAVSGSENPFETADSTEFTINRYSSPLFYDVNGDDAMDLVVGEHNGAINYFTGNADGSVFTPDSSGLFDSVDCGTYAAPAFADLDADGSPELACGGILAVSYYKIGESGIFEKVDTNNNPFADIVYFSIYSTAFEKVTNNDTADLVVSNSDGGIYLYEGNDDGTFTQKTGVDNPFYGITTGSSPTFAFVDLDKNGTNDVVFGGEDGLLSYYVKDSYGNFTEKTDADNPFASIIATGGYSAPVFFDVDDDGDKDLVLGNYKGTIQYYTNDGLVFNEKTEALNPFGHVVVQGYSRPTFADINYDLITDFIVSDYKKSFVYLGTIASREESGEEDPTGDDDSIEEGNGGATGANENGGSGAEAPGNATTGDDDDAAPTTTATKSGGGCSLQTQGDFNVSFAVLWAAGVSLGLARIGAKRVEKLNNQRLPNQN